jgi:hypothetical protein
LLRFGKHERTGLHSSYVCDDHGFADRGGIDGVPSAGASGDARGSSDRAAVCHLLIGELAGGESERADRVAKEFGRAIEVRVSPNLTGAIWSKKSLVVDRLTVLDRRAKIYPIKSGSYRRLDLGSIPIARSITQTMIQLVLHG